MAYNHFDFLRVAVGEWNGKAFSMRQLSSQNKNNETSEIEKTPTVVIRKIRDAILDEVFKPGDWIGQHGPRQAVVPLHEQSRVTLR
jgi:hypothetical protein